MNFIVRPAATVTADFAAPPFPPTPEGEAPDPTAIWTFDEACPSRHYLELNVSIEAGASFNIGIVLQK
jgi:hypothetical protein